MIIAFAILLLTKCPQQFGEASETEKVVSIIKEFPFDKPLCTEIPVNSKRSFMVNLTSDQM